MKKGLIIVFLLILSAVAYPLGWALFPWAQSLSAVEFAGGIKALLSPNAGTWIIPLSIVVAGTSLVSAILVALLYKVDK